MWGVVNTLTLPGDLGGAAAAAAAAAEAAAVVAVAVDSGAAGEGAAAAAGVLGASATKQSSMCDDMVTGSVQVYLEQSGHVKTLRSRRPLAIVKRPFPGFAVSRVFL